MKPSGIGGQAVLEGVMMRNGGKYAVAVRKPDGEIAVDVKEQEPLGGQGIRKIPLVRGVVNFVDSLVVGMTTLNYSASFYEDEETGESGSLSKAETGLTVALAIVLAVGIFMVLPFFLSRLLNRFITSDTVLTLIEGVIRICLLLGYIGAISKMKDIHRVFMYHGAEHKSINCIENGLPLTVENVRKQSRRHRRCGTSFILIIVVLSVIFFMFIRVDKLWLRLIIRLLLVPVIAAVAYEFIRFAGRSDSKIVQILSEPGMWLQGMTTREPDDSMIEVAIASVEAVFDWKAFLAGEDAAEEADEEGASAAVAEETAGDAAVLAAPAEEDADEGISEEAVIAAEEDDAAVEEDDEPFDLAAAERMMDEDAEEMSQTFGKFFASHRNDASGKSRR